MTAKEFLNNVFGYRWTWAVGITLGILSAVVDLRSATRWPYSILMISFSFALAYWQSRWAWRWPFLVACCLPLVVLTTWNWGPYQTDQFDVFYGLLPAAIGTVLGLALRSSEAGSRPLKLLLGFNLRERRIFGTLPKRTPSVCDPEFF